jgi:hypothetical protein
MNDSLIRLGVIGLGEHCTTVILPLLAFLPVRVVAVADPDENRRRLVAERFGCIAGHADAATMFARETLDAVIICGGLGGRPARVGGKTAGAERAGHRGPHPVARRPGGGGRVQKGLHARDPAPARLGATA